MSYSPDERDTQQKREATGSNWPKTEKLPAPVEGGSSILLAFHGLMGFAYNPEHGHCEIGIHSQAPGHEFKIVVYEYSGAAKPKEIRRREFGSAGSAPIDSIHLEANNPAEAGVNFYMPTISGNQSGGVAAAHTCHDFRRVPDFEGPDLYDRPLTKKPGVFKPIITINTGTFLTLLPAKKFKLVSQHHSSKPLGNIAWLIGNLISLKERGNVTLRINEEELPPLSPDANKSYLILFDNSCPKEVCPTNPKSNKKEERNDFHLYYETFEMPYGEEEYELYLDEASEDVAGRAGEPDSESKNEFIVASNLSSFLRDLAEKRSNDEAPCGGVGYGKGGGFGG